MLNNGCATSTSATSNVSQRYVVRQIGTTTYIEPSAPVGIRVVAGAVVGTDIAAGLQSKPIPLQKGTDQLCFTEMKKYLPKDSCFDD